ncbi:glycine zipper 2TM domain-containing protein [Variovorax sp. YR752]|uniref:glycine zipper 2TM domain-containing protein n=1 Tax=Variovorax sp. YR752 TaxID=1884383 RepID=UPI00313808D5
MSTELSPGAVAAPAAPSRTVWLIAGVLGAASIAAGAGMLARKGLPEPASQPVPAQEAAAPEAKPVEKPVARVATKANPAPAPKVAAAPVCQSCGVVESVRSVTKKGEGSGVGAVAGGVIGAALGNQVGGGNGRKAMTVIGAVGGGVAGHEIEKRAKSTTVQQVTIRMDDGSVRTVEQTSAPAVGARVQVEGSRLRALGGQG